MQELAHTPPTVKNGRHISDAKKLRKTLARYYTGRRRFYAEDFPDFYDADLRAIFGNGEPGGETASRTMRKNRAALVTSIVQWTGQRKYTVSMLVRRLIRPLRGVEAASAAGLRAAAIRSGRLSRSVGHQPSSHGQIQEVCLA